jgi:hypothetical protein
MDKTEYLQEGNPSQQADDRNLHPTLSTPRLLRSVVII